MRPQINRLELILDFHVLLTHADTKSGSDYDTSQGHPVAEKEKARHAKHEDAFEHEKTEEATGAST